MAYKHLDKYLKDKGLQVKDTKSALKTKNKDKVDKDFKQADINEIVLQMAKDLGYI